MSAPISLRETSVALRVRPNDLDRLGHVNNAVVLEYFEAGRWHWMEEHGLLHATSVLPVVSRVTVDYRLEIPPSMLEVCTAVEGLTEVNTDDDHYRVVFLQCILSAERRVATQARVEVAFVSAATRSLATLADFLTAAGS